MKARVFIAWSGTNKIAVQVKKVLETKQYKCTIGGNADNNSTYASVGDTVIQQIKSCNQAIIIFQNKADGSVSNNLFFELGYVMAMYGPMKIHCVRRDNEQVVLPSDFDNSFVEPIANGGDDTAFVEGIVDYFTKRQKMSINENKMDLINNRYRIHDYIQSHFSERGSKCSDYELAQYILFYIQAAHMFNDERKVYQELKKFKDDYHSNFSDELRTSVNVGMSFLDMILHIRYSEEGAMYLERSDLRSMKDVHLQCYEDLESDDMGSFREWCRVFISEHLTYAYNLYADLPGQTEEIKIKNMKKSKEWAFETIKNLENLEEHIPLKDNNDHIGIIAVFYGYVYRNLFLSTKYLKDGDEFIWIEKTKKERTLLKNNFQAGSIDSQLYNTFMMEYYLTLVEYLAYSNKVDMDEDDIEDALDDIGAYITQSKKQIDRTKYIDLIEHMYNKQMAQFD